MKKYCCLQQCDHEYMYEHLFMHSEYMPQHSEYNEDNEKEKLGHIYCVILINVTLTVYTKTAELICAVSPPPLLWFHLCCFFSMSLLFLFSFPCFILYFVFRMLGSG